MTAYKAWFAWALARLGWPGLLGLALVLGSVVFGLGVVEPASKAAHQAQVQAARLARLQLVTAKAEPLKDWRADLPTDHAAYGHLSRLFAVAEASGLALDEGSYRMQAEPEQDVNRLMISLPVSGDYPTIRAFLAAALNQDRALGLESIRFSRESMSDQVLEAELNFALYLGAHP